MRVITIKKYDVQNGPGTRLSIWTAGCCNHCPGCWAQNTWNPHQGVPLSDKLNEIEALVNDPYITGVSLLGGDPLYNIMDADRRKQNWREFIELLKMCSVKSIWMWTGYTWDEITAELSSKELAEMCNYIDYMVVGRFDINQRNLDLPWRGSSNQQILKIRCNAKGHYPEDVTKLADSGKLKWTN